MSVERTRERALKRRILREQKAQGCDCDPKLYFGMSGYRRGVKIVHWADCSVIVATRSEKAPRRRTQAMIRGEGTNA